MKYVVMLKADGTTKILEVPEKASYDWYADQIDCDWIEVVRKTSDEHKDNFNGIPIQNLASVFIEAKRFLMRDRLLQAIKEARGRGLLSLDDDSKIKGEFGI